MAIKRFAAASAASYDLPRSRVLGTSPGLLDGNPPPRRGAPGDDLVLVLTD